MKTLLVLAQHPDLANSIRECLSSEHYKVVHRLSIEDAEPLLIHGLINASIIDVDLTDVQGHLDYRKASPQSSQVPDSSCLPVRIGNGKKKLIFMASPIF